MLYDIAIILSLIVVNGVFAMTELAVVSSRSARLQARAQAGSKGAKIALKLKEDPSKFLSTVQIGITLIGIFSGAFSGVTLAEPFAIYLSQTFPVLGTHADDVAMAIVVTAVTYLSLVVGELVPKQVALKFADEVAIFIAPPIRWISILARPIVWVLDVSNKLVLKLLGVRPNDGQTTSQEDVKAAIAEGTAAGVVGKLEQRMLERVMNLNTVPVRAAMTHRQDIVWFESTESVDAMLDKIKQHRHSNYPLCEGVQQRLIGIVSTKDMVLQQRENKAFDVRAIATQPLLLPENTSVDEALEKFRASKVHVAIVIDQYESLAGMITLKDIMEAIVGVMPEHTDESYNILTREDGSWLADGRIPLFEVEAALGIGNMRGETSSFNTLAGFMLYQLGHIPKDGDHFLWNDYRFEVMDMDRNRIDKVLISLTAKPTES